MPTLQEQAKSVFDQALEIESTQDRSNFLDNQFLQFPDIRAAVEGLLQAYNDAGSFLESPAVSPPETEDASVPSEPPSQQIGPYKLLQKIGEGGMGTVFMAEQTRPISRRVAVKIIKLGMDTKSVIARFEAERQALAMMDHPNIAKVLDAGTTDDGRPYFVMELVKGVPMTEYCDDHKLTIRERLELFTQVCQAVQHAHQKGIIHRDIKPSNVLVAQYDGKPVPKVIDFGVAKAISQRLTEKTMFTQYGQIVGTLEYMSPEQAQFNQLDVDTRSDIYSLGVLLYELLTGETPFDGKRLRSSAFEEVLRILREEEPPKPSNRISTLGEQATRVSENRSLEATRLGTALRGDLDWIVMKSLEKDRDRRYETANALLQDLGRFLSDQPVEARRPSNAYRLRKYVRRNRGLVASFSTIVLLMAFGLTMNYLSLRMARDQEQLAQQALGSLRDVALEHAISETLNMRSVCASAAIKLAEQASVDAEWLAVLDGFRLAGDGKYEQAVMELKPFTQPGDTHPSYLLALATLACAHINSGHDREYLDCMRRLRELTPNTSDEILFAATAESASDPERVVELLASPKHDWRHVWAVALRGGARGWIALQNNDPVMMKSAITDLEFAELFSGATPGLTFIKSFTLRIADEIARLTGDEIAQRESRDRLLAMTEELSRLPPSRLIGTNLIASYDRLGQFDDLIRTIQSMDFGDTVMIEYAAAPMYARCDSAREGLEMFDDLQFDKNNTYALISRAHFLADLPDRRSELSELYNKAIANKQDSPQERYQALNILALAQEPKMLRQEANVILDAFEENELADWGIKEGLLIASGKWDSTDLEKTESIFTRCTAYYFLGMRCLADGNAEEAAQHFQTSYDTGVHSFFEYAWSKAYLSRMQKDPSWPSWISATYKPESN